MAWSQLRRKSSVPKRSECGSTRSRHSGFMVTALSFVARRHYREGPMLHKTSYMRGFHILATDGEIGHVDDFLVNESWTVQYLVVDTSNWLGGKSVLISTSKLDAVSSPDK